MGSIIELMRVKFVHCPSWLFFFLVLHENEIHIYANEDAFGDYGLVQNSCALLFGRRRHTNCDFVCFFCIFCLLPFQMLPDMNPDLQKHGL